uniref:cation channel sperm-associated protein 1 n=1 Tax=Jaculus jaculus TaxID=51337 RepID=UPI001E1B2887|nr:cation channel sperm-associated protein 1 [Jaculus jaculus]
MASALSTSDQCRIQTAFPNESRTIIGGKWQMQHSNIKSGFTLRRERCASSAWFPGGSHHYGKHHHYGRYHHGGPRHSHEDLSHLSSTGLYNQRQATHHGGSYHHGTPHFHGEHHHGGHHPSEHQYHGGHHPSEHQYHGDHHGSDHHYHRDHHGSDHQYHRDHHLSDHHYYHRDHHGSDHQYHRDHHLSDHHYRRDHHPSDHQYHRDHHGSDHQYHRDHHLSDHHYHRDHHPSDHQYHRDYHPSDHHYYRDHHGSDHQYHRDHHPSDHHYYRDHHLREHQYHRDHHPRDHYSMEQHQTSQLSIPHKIHSTTDASHAHPGAKGSSPSLTTSHFTFRSRHSSKVHPQDTFNETSTWNEDEQYQKRKNRVQRAHKKLHSGNAFQWLWEKISLFFWTLRGMIRTLTQTLAFETFVFLVVCLNTAILVAQTFAELEIRGEWYFMVLDCIFLCIYVVEALLKLIALGLEYFYDPWNNLDFFIMAMAVLDFMLVQTNSLSYTFYNHSLFLILKVFKSMRALRAIRVLRRLSILTKVHEVTGTLSGSLPSIMAILALMFTCLFLFSVVLRALFRKSDPFRFQNIFTTLFTLFTMLTLDDWSLIYMDSRAKGAWYIIPILMIYIIIQYFIFLNLVIAVLVDNFQMALLKGLEKVKLEKAARANEKLLEDSLTELTKAEAEGKLSAGTLQMYFIERKFGTMTEKQRELHFQYLQLVASVEQHQQKFRSQASVIDEVVDAAFEAGEDDFGK